MVYKTDIETWKNDVEDREVLLQVGQIFNRALREEVEAIGSEEITVDVGVEHFYGSTIRVRINGMRSVTEASRMISRAAGFDVPPLKLRFRGASKDGSCEIPSDEWYLTTTTDDDSKVHVDLNLAQSYQSGRTARYTITAYSLPVPGYLYGVRETEEVAGIRAEEENAEASERQRLERNARVRANRAAAKRRREHPVIEGPPERKPMLLGPKELSLCKDAPEDVETPQLEEVNGKET